MIQVYTPTSAHSDDEVEKMYEDLSRALHTTQTAHFNVVMGDSNAKVGVHISGESVVGPHGFRSRNHRGQMLANFLEKERLFLMNSFFETASTEVGVAKPRPCNKKRDRLHYIGQEANI